MKELIRKLVETYGPSGNEDKIRATIEEEVRPLVDEIKTDKLGNLIAIRRGTGARIMLAAHMDEIGLMVTFIDDKGFLRYTAVGGVSPHRLLGQRVIFENGTVATFGSEKIEDIKDLSHSKMFMDIGAKDKASAEARIKIGDVAGYHQRMEEVGSRLVSKSMDDRIGCTVLIEALRRFHEQEGGNEVYFVFTVQEEVGLRGARTAAYGLEPDMAIAVDVTGTGDTPKANTMAVELGKGPAIKVKDVSVISHPRVKDLMVKVARQDNIPYQMEVLEWGGTDAGAIHLTREGVPSGVLSIPCRYVHSPSEMVDIDDVENAVRLLVAILRHPVGDELRFD